MEKRKWLWKRKSTDRISGETDSSGSLSSPSERFSDEQDCSKESPNNNTQSPEVTSKAVVEDEFSDSIKNLTEKLSAALVNVSAKEDLVKQHVKVAEEAVAGWEKSENEVAALKQQLEAAVQQNVSLEVRASHLDGALKECVRQLRQAKEEQDQRICDALVDKTSKWESIKSKLEDKILELQVHKDTAMSNYPSSFEPSESAKLDSLEKENSMLKAELLVLSEELEIKTIERDLSTQAAETSSKQHLESIRKLAKIEAECRRLQALARKSSNFNDQKSASSSMYVDSLTDSQSDSGDLFSSVDVDVCKKSKFIQHGIENNCSDSWASALIVELDQFKNEKAMTRNLTACSLEIDIMDDFLEMERLAAAPESKSKVSHTESGDAVDTPSSLEKEMKAELDSTRKRLAESEDKLEKMEAEKAEMEKMTCHMSDLRQELGKIQTENKELHNLTCDMSDLREKLKQTEAEKTELQNMSSHMGELEDKLEKMEAENAELEAKLVKMEAEKAMLEKALDRSQDSLREFESKLRETETLLQEFQMELASVNETKEGVEFQLISMEAEARTTAANIDSLKAQIEKEKGLAEQLAAKCLELENELNLKSQVVELHPIENYHLDPKPKQEDLDVAADKLAECQKTIASLGRQLESLATLEDFLIDTANLPGFSAGASLVPKARSESWKLHLNDTFATRSDSEVVISSHTVNGNDGELPSSSSPWASSSDNNTPKNRNGFGKLFSRSKNGIQVENHQG